MKTPTAPQTGFFRRHGVLLTAAGFLFGAGAGTFIFTVEKPVYEGTTQFRPLRPAGDATGITHSEWLQNEVTSLGSAACLLRMVKNLNLENEFHMTADEAVKEVQKQLQISVLPGTTIINITMQGPKAEGCASFVNAVRDARAEMTGYAMLEEQKRERQMYEARVNTLTASIAKNGGQPGEQAQLADMRSRLTTASLTLSIPPYAEILQYGKQPVLPVGPEWFPRTARWTIIGTVIGLALSLCLGAFRRRMDRNSGPQVFPSRPVAAVEY